MLPIIMISMLVLYSVADVPPPGPYCNCSTNPFINFSQDFLGEKEINCEETGACYVHCDSDCGDVGEQSGFTAAKDRCISKAACHVKAKSTNFEIEKKLSEEVKRQDPVDTDGKFVLSGNGEVAGYQGHGLGLYTYNINTGYYVQDGGDYYLAKDRTGWFTFPRISGCADKINDFSCIAFYVANLRTADPITGEPWSFGKNKSWVEDSSIEFKPVTDSSCLFCRTVTLSSTGPAMEERSEYLGKFERVSSYSAGRPVYKNEYGKFLMMKNEYTTFSVWDNVERSVSAGKGVEGVRGIRSLTGPTCVTDLGNEVESSIQAAELNDDKEDGNNNINNDRFWQFSTKTGDWVTDPSIILETDCST